MSVVEDRCRTAYREVLDTGRIDSDRYTLADFYELDEDDLFAKALAGHEYIEALRGMGYYTYQRPLLSACDPRVRVWDESRLSLS